MGALKKYMEYEKKVVDRRKATKKMYSDVRDAKLKEAKDRKLKLKKKYTPKARKARRKQVSKKFQKALSPANVYGIKI